MLNILICNDTANESEELRYKALRYYSQRVKAIMIFEEKDAFYFYLEEHKAKPVILIIDLDFCGDGLKIANKAKEINPWSEVIFLCKNGKWTLDVYDIDHIYGLECPLSEEKLEHAIKKAINEIDGKTNTLFPIKKKGAIYAIPINGIKYLEQDRRMIHIHTEKEIHTIYTKFSEIEKYKTDYFVRCHNSYAVNLFYVESMKDLHFIMKDGKKIPISRSRKDETLEAYEAFITRRPIVAST